MSSKSSETQPSGQPIPAYILPCGERDDEVSLVDLWRVLVQRKLVILWTFLLSLILAVGYLLAIQPIYTATSRLGPPEIADIKSFLLGEPEIWTVMEEDGKAMDYYASVSVLEKYAMQSITPVSVFNLFVRNYRSEQVRRQFLASDNPLNFRISELDPRNPIVVASLSHHDPEYAANQLNKFIQFVNHHTAEKIADNIKLIIQIEREKLEKKLNLILEQVEKNPHGENTESGAGEGGVPVQGIGMVGPDVEMLLQRIAYFKSLTIDSADASVINIDSPASPPSIADKPNKSLILVSAVILGVFLGAFMAFLTEFINKAKQQM